MERRIYFIFGDFLTCITAAIAGGYLAQLVVPIDWYMPVGMIGGMIGGMIAGMLVGFIFSPLFGALEVIIPASLAGMMSGMIVGMLQTMEGVTANVFPIGIFVGSISFVFIYNLQHLLHGEVK